MISGATRQSWNSNLITLALSPGLLQDHSPPFPPWSSCQPFLQPGDSRPLEINTPLISRGGFRVSLGEGCSPAMTHTPDHFLAPQDFRAENILSLLTHGGPFRAQACFSQILLRIIKAGTTSPWLWALRNPWAGVKL